MGEHPDGLLDSDSCAIPAEADDGSYTTIFKSFPKLANIDAEFTALRSLADANAGTMVLDSVNLSDARPGEDATSMLRNKLSGRSYDIVHYAGHAWSEKGGAAHLILPGVKSGQASSLSVRDFATFDGLGATRLVYLSACRGVSRGSLQALVAQGIPYSLGFRFEVKDEKARAFATTFYAKLIQRRFISGAFQEAFAVARLELAVESDDHIWLSAVLVAQAQDWAAIPA